MSTLNVANISDGTDTVETGYVVNGSAKAWVNFNGTGTVVTRDSLNVSNLVDVALGAHRLEFSNSFNNDDYSYTAAGDVASALFVTIYSLGNPNTEDDITLRSYNGSYGAADCANTHAALHGDLA